MSDTFDPTRIQFAVKPPIGPSKTYSPLAAYLQAALNRVANAGLTVDGLYGPKTSAAVASFQRVRNIRSDGAGLCGRWTWYELDWLVYDGWQPASATLTTHRPGCKGGCTAIVAGRNYHTGQYVNDRGLTREAQRLADVTNWFAPVDFRRNFAVDRNARNSTRLSRHALGVANDDMTDLDRDKQLEDHEIRQCNMVADWIIARTAGWPDQYDTSTVDGKPQTITFTGPDRLATAVWGNHRLDGKWWQPLRLGLVGRADWTWTPPRRTWKPQTGNVHNNHCHFDVATGAPA